MVTINQYVQMYDLVFEGKQVEYYGHTICRDSNSWIVDGVSVDSIQHKRDILALILKKCDMAKTLAQHIGLDVDNINDEFYIVYDSIDNLVLLVNNQEQRLNVIYIENTHVVIEQIYKDKNIMVFNSFKLGAKQIKQTSFSSELTDKSKLLINKINNEKNFHFSQNIFYDILPKGIQTFDELINKTSNLTSILY